MATVTVATPTPWDELARRALGTERAMHEVLARNPALAVLPECPAGAVVDLPEAPPPAPAAVAPTLPPWKR